MERIKTIYVDNIVNYVYNKIVVYWIIIIVVKDVFTKDGRKNLTILQEENIMMKIWKVQQGWKEKKNKLCV